MRKSVFTVTTAFAVALAAGLSRGETPNPPAAKAPAVAPPTPAVLLPPPPAAAPRSRAINLPNLPSDGPWHANHEMRLRTDGNLPGQLRAFDSNGNLAPVRARLFFLQKGQIVTKATADETGYFQVTNLDPGVYSVVAAGPTGFGALSIRILSQPDSGPRPKVKATGTPAANAALLEPPADGSETLTLDISLVAPGDIQQAAQILQQEISDFGVPPVAPIAPGAGTPSFPIGSGIGGGGAGGAGGAAGTAAGLGGLTAAVVARKSS